MTEAGAHDRSLAIFGLAKVMTVRVSSETRAVTAIITEHLYNAIKINFKAASPFDIRWLSMNRYHWPDLSRDRFAEY